MASKRATSLMTLWLVALLTVVLGWFTFAQGGTPASQNTAQSNIPVPAGMTRGPNGAPIPSLQPPVPQLPPGMQLPPNAPNPFALPAGAPKASPKKPLRASAPIANPVFSQIPNYPAGYYVEAIAVGDVNGDGIPDVVVANQCQSSSCPNGGVSVLLGNRDGSYQAPVSYSSGGIEAWSVALGDFNGDGKLDIAVGNYYADSTYTTSNVSVLLGNGDGTFQSPVSAPVPGFYIPAVAVGDFNGDGKLDLVVSSDCQNNSNCSGELSVLLGNGDGTLQSAVSYSSGGFDAYSVLVADFNGDGKPDLAVVNVCATTSCSNGSVGVLLNNGDGTFQAPSSLISGGEYSFAGIVGDFNGDGKADIAIMNECLSGNCANGSVSVFLGNGDGTFSAPVNTQDLQQNYSRLIAAGDVNGDGKLDLVIGNSSSNNYLQVLLGNGDGSFQAATQLLSVYDVNAVAVADVNADGKLDILAATPCPNGSCSSSALDVLLGNGDGTFQVPPSYHSGGEQATSVATADFNGDGKADLVVTNICASNNCSNGSVGILLGNGNGTLQPVVSYSSGGLDPFALAVGDFNGDGKPDVVVVNECSTGACPNGSVSVLLGNGDGTLQSPITSATGGIYSWDLVIGDFNGDGKLDIAVANNYADTTYQSGSVSVMLGNGDGTFQSPVTYALGGRYTPSIAAGDFNGDGKLDLAVSNDCQSSSSCTGGVSILLGNGDGTFQAPQAYSSAGYDTVSVALGDFNGDGKLDVALADNTDVSVLLGNGDGTFQTAVSYPTACCTNGPQSLVVKDFNGDGSMDLASTTYAGSVNLLLGNGDGTFQTSTPYSAGGNNYGLTAVDLNGDGKPDLAIANATNPWGSVTVLLNIVSGFRNATRTAVTSSLNPAGGGQTVTFTATVTPAFDGPPTGIVTFYDGINVLGTGTLSGTQATFSTSSLALGAHSITASYVGDTNFLSSTSPVLTETITSSTTTTTLASSLNPSTYGQSVTFTASVTSNGSGTPTGAVTFTDGINPLGTSLLSGGQAMFTSAGLAAGAHSITATYSGDSGFTGSSSSPLAQTVNQAGTTLLLTSNVNPSAYNQSVAFTATITPQFGGQATGTIVFVSEPSGLTCSSAVSNNVATCNAAAPFLRTGTNSVTATYNGDPDFTSSTSAPLSQVVNQATTSTMVASSLNPAYIKQQITFTATVTGQFGGLPTGSVTFKAGNATLGTATLNGSGQAALTTSFSTAGTRSITAIYVGDVNYHGSTSSALSQAVDKFSTATGVGSSLNPSLVDESVTFTATVSSTYGPIPNGDKVTFKNGTTVLATVSLTGGTASYTTSSLVAGNHTITASYLGDASFQTSSGIFQQTVNKNPSSSALASTVNPSTYGQAVIFTATISGSAGTPTGSVTFKNGNAVLGTATLTSGTASFTTSTLAAGTHSITAVYSGDSTYLASSSSALIQKVNKAPTATSISSSPNPSVSGQSVTFTATVTSSASGLSGTVTFKSGTTVLGTGTLNSGGVATFTTSTLPVGSDPITANYSGNPDFLQSAASMVQVVNP